MPARAVPTAHTSLAATPATACSALAFWLPLGLRTTVQAAPSQCSINVCSINAGLSAKPTAQASLAPKTASPRRVLWPGPRLALGTGFQLGAQPGVGLPAGISWA